MLCPEPILANDPLFVHSQKTTALSAAPAALVQAAVVTRARASLTARQLLASCGKRAYVEFSQCLSRAGRGKMIVSIYKWRKKYVSLTKGFDGCHKTRRVTGFRNGPDRPRDLPRAPKEIKNTAFRVEFSSSP
jgi:hypothetical protein